MWIRKIEDNILYEDRELIVCHKPAGMAVQSAGITAMDMESALKNYLAAQTPGKAPYLGIVHRLDQPVEGVVVFAKTPAAAGELSRQISAGKMEKYYLAVTKGRPREKTGTLTDYLKKDGKTNTSSVVSAKTPGAKQAKLTYEVLSEIQEEKEKYYLVRIHLETGRHHQIRVQMAHAEMPLVGDCKYNSQDKSGLPLALCSCSLAFSHPKTKKKMKFETTPKGAAFQYFFKKE